MVTFRKDLQAFEKKDKIKIVESLAKKSVSNVKLTGDVIRLEFDGKVIRNKIVVRKHYPSVGNWNKIKNVIYIDDDILTGPKKEIISLCIHESVEQYVAKKYDLRGDAEAHMIAETVEHRWSRSANVDLNNYELKVDLICRKEANRR